MKERNSSWKVKFKYVCFGNDYHFRYLWMYFKLNAHYSENSFYYIKNYDDEHIIDGVYLF